MFAHEEAIATNGAAGPSKIDRIGVINWGYGSNECQSEPRHHVAG